MAKVTRTVLFLRVSSCAARNKVKQPLSLMSPPASWLCQPAKKGPQNVSLWDVQIVLVRAGPQANQAALLTWWDPARTVGCRFGPSMLGFPRRGELKRNGNWNFLVVRRLESSLGMQGTWVQSWSGK